MKIKKYNYKMNLLTACFYIFWTTLLVGKGLGYANNDAIFRYMTYMVMPFAICKLLFTKWRRQELITCICLNLLGIFVWIFSGEVDVLLTMIVITSCKNIDLQNLMKLSLKVKALFFIVITTLSIMGILDIQYKPRYYSSTVFDVRYALGYGQPNATHYTLFLIIVLAILTYRERLRLYHYLIMMAYNWFIFSYTDSRTGFLMTSLVLILVYFINTKVGNLFKKYILNLVTYSYVIGAMLSLIICGLFAKVPFLQSFGTLSSRFGTATEVMNTKELSLFGVNNVVTDFGYIEILYGKGIIVFLLFIVGMTVLAKKLKKENMVVEIMVMFVYAIYTLSESYTSSILMNVGLMYLVMVIYPKDRGLFSSLKTSGSK